MDEAGTSLEKPRSARIACRKCHARKVKCSGGIPCTNCQQANSSSECIYPSRVRRIRVQQSYIDDLLEEIHRLRQAAQAPGVTVTRQTVSLTPGIESHRAASADPSPALSATSIEADALKDAVQNPLLDERPWFFPLTPEMPILIGEATDVAFATRFRQEILGSSQHHFPRTQHVHDETICSLWTSDCPWPAPSRARFLLKVALSTVCRRYYLVRRSSVIQLLEQAIRNPAICDTISSCKLLALLALGEAYSTRTCLSKDGFPGIGYYVSATRMLRVLSEQPRIDCVEIMLMLSIYSLAMNRRHSAYCMVGYAVRFSIIMGLHLNVPHHQLPDRELQEHRNRVWWTAYILDRSWASMLGKPTSIQDEDIDVDLPSDSLWASGRTTTEDFADAEYLIASLRLANLGAQIAGSIYSRKTHPTASFSCRVQQALRDLGKWLQKLPGHLRTAIDQAPSNAAMPIITLYLYFNQCLILASRPVLLYVLRLRRPLSGTTTSDGTPSASETILALSEACIQCARRSCRILTESWISGSFPTFDYTYTQYLFSASIILAMSSILQSPDSEGDGDDFEAAAQILDQLDQNGNFAAKEFCKHIEATKEILSQISLGRDQVGCDHQLDTDRGLYNATMSHPAQEARPPVTTSTDASGLSLAEFSLEDLLLQPDLDLGSLEPSILDVGYQTFVWPEDGYGSLGNNENNMN